MIKMKRFKVTEDQLRNIFELGSAYGDTIEGRMELNILLTKLASFEEREWDGIVELKELEEKLIV